jgi:hypothetical protein
MAIDDWINVPAEQNQGWGARWNSWMNRLVKYLRALDKTNTWTPALAQGAGVASTLTIAEYVRQGDTVSGYCHIAANAAGTAANNVTVSAPLTMAPVHAQSVGSGYLAVGGATYPVHVYMATATTFGFYHTHLLSSFVGTGAFAAALAAGNTLSFHFEYPV